MRENLEELNELGLAEIAGDARRRRAHPHLRRARPARGLQGPPVLRQGRVRGAPHHGHAHGRQAHRHARSRLRARARRPRPPAAQDRSARRRRRRGRRPAPTSPLDVPVFTPPFLGARASPRASRSTRSRRTSTRPRCSATSGSSGPRRRGETDDEFKERHPAGAPRASSTMAKAEGSLVPAVAWGYFPVNADGDDLVVWTDDDRRTERLRFTLPPPAEGPLPLHRRLLPAGRLGRGRLRRRSTS